MRRLLIWALIATILPLFNAANARAEKRISFELVLENAYGQEQARKWQQLFEGVSGVTLRIRSGRAGDRLAVNEIGEGQFKSFQVVGILTADGRLRLLGGTFTPRDTAKLREWIRQLRAGGEEGLLSPKLAFGMTPKQLAAAHEQLSRKVNASTKGKTVAEAAKTIATSAGLRLQSDPRARAGSREIVNDELEGLSAGTALAAALRPGGLVLTLTPSPAGAELWVRVAGDAEEFWPVGWPLEQPPGTAAPELFKYLEVEIDDFPLATALQTVASRLPLPFLYDYNSLAREGIDPAAAKVSHPAGRTYYKRILDRLLSQARLKSEIRQDEAGKPFFWITTVRQRAK